MSAAVTALQTQINEVVAKKEAAIKKRDEWLANAETQQGTIDAYQAEEDELAKALRAVKADTAA